MIASFFPDHILGRGQNAGSSRTSVASKVTATEGHKNQLYHRIIYALISDKFIKNRRLRKSSAFALLYLSYVFIKMLPVTLAIETGAGGVVAVATAGGGGGGGDGTGLKSGVTGLTTHSRTLPEMAMGQPPPHLDEDDDDYDDEEYDEYDIVKNKSAKGMYVGAPCEFTCHPKLHHVYCDPSTNVCSCEKDYVVLLGLLKGCAKPKKLGDQCFHDQTCIYNDEHALCVQIRHNAICQCAPGFHSVSYSKPTKRVFCTQDMASITADLPTLFGVTSGIAVLAGLICMVLHLFSKTKYPRPRHFGDANLAPPILYNSDTGIPLTIQSARPSSRSSQRSSGSIGSYGNRRPSSAPLHGSKGVLVSTSRTGAARSAAILLVSCHISALRSSRSNTSQHPSDHLSDDNMTRYLERQLEHQKQLLFLDIPSLRNHNKLLSKFCKTTKYASSSNDDSSYDDEPDDNGVNHYSYENDSVEMGALPTPASEVANVAVPEDQV
ncbi:uncharacterized protein LOC120426203 isoform X1 [Culex pipiens pallens]|uniref:uncharacterized protein LOC120426203 isoform X1 n=1 Tax=Culex pipiens pallens TaxID=42434 RepID=UPI0019542BB5|nr:uncharacterized protein LOC120426203 isoform X1 [Culex pipiens pallens]XP_039446842.1 uncharacterized protein LOC120426203 isoform X1 [Culex pipiens pallens]XP_039446843.1 uncharacterized protein LOC120426203 isoform X1 [Culex pipiens pallens]XP_039446844.1 uncharacterized protein LOC120426203 isoform X1 [Culex pipiens pallens]